MVGRAGRSLRLSASPMADPFQTAKSPLEERRTPGAGAWSGAIRPRSGMGRAIGGPARAVTEAWREREG